MKKIKLILITALAVIATKLSSQNIFFPTKVGTTLTFVQKDDKGEITGYTRQTITKVDGSGENMTISYLYESMDEQKNVVIAVPCEMVIKNDVMIFDVKHVFVGQLKDANEKLGDVTGTPLKFPNNLAPEQSIDDAHLNAAVHKGILTIHVKVDMTNGKCVAIEDLHVPAGTFKSHKILQDVTTTMLGKTNHQHVFSWGAHDIGIVKMVTNNNDGSLHNTVELIEIKNN